MRNRTWRDGLDACRDWRDGGVDWAFVCDGVGRDLAELCGEPVAAVSGLDETASLTWQRDAGDPRVLLGKIGGVTVITLTLTGDVTAAGGGDTATPTVTAVLSDNFPHQNAPDADSLTITGLVVNATDRDGEITTGTINVTVVDDAPSVEVVAAVADGTPATDSIAEGGVLNGRWTLNDGADDVASIRVSVAGQLNQVVTLPGGEPAVFDLPAGVLTVNANGTWSFAAKISLDRRLRRRRCRSRSR